MHCYLSVGCVCSLDEHPDCMITFMSSLALGLNCYHLQKAIAKDETPCLQASSLKVPSGVVIRGIGKTNQPSLYCNNYAYQLCARAYI